MRAFLTFRLPQEQGEFDAAIQGSAAKALLWNLDQRLRSVIKHGDHSEETTLLAQEIRQMIAQEGLAE